MFLKLKGETIIGHAHTSQGEYNIEVKISAEKLAPNGQYVYKYSAGNLVALNQTEKNSHPNLRNLKLNALRNKRITKLNEADKECNKHVDGDTNRVGTYGSQKTYRIALRAITSNYKDSNGDGTLALDAFAIDMSDFNAWPVKPT